MPGFDDVLSILENKSRREILELLTKEPHYALQLSDLLQISQQAVVKHLSILEKAGFVSVDKVPSEKGGPPRKVYKVTESFCLRLDLGPRLFKTSGKMMPSGGPMRLSSKLPGGLEDVIDTMGTRRRIPMNEAMSILSKLQMRLEKMDEQRDALTKLGPGAEGEYVLENDGTSLLYLVDMVGIGENLWQESSVQIMAASCCLSPFLAMVGIVGLVRSSKPSKTGPKILVFDSNVGIPTTEEVFRSVNEISKESVTSTATPDPWKNEISEDEGIIEEIPDSTEGTQLDEVGGDWQTWDEG